MKVVDLPLTQLRPAPWNPKVMTGLMAARLKASLWRYGLVEKLVVRPLREDTYEVLSGNQRLAVLQGLGYQSAPVL